MPWECRECFPHYRFQRKPLVSDLGIHHGTCVTHVPLCMSGSLTHGGGKNVPGIPSACATRSFTFLVRGPSLHIIVCADAVSVHRPILGQPVPYHSGDVEIVQRILTGALWCFTIHVLVKSFHMLGGKERQCHQLVCEVIFCIRGSMMSPKSWTFLQMAWLK